MHNCSTDSLYQVFSQVIRFHYHRIHVLLDKLGLYPGQPPLLLSLGRRDGQSQKDLSRIMHVKPATITVMLSRMEKADLVERRPDPDDQRISRVYLKDQGREVFKQLEATMREVEAECFANFSEEERIVLRRLLMQMRDNLKPGVDLVEN